jgi:hypothetical protein
LSVREWINVMANWPLREIKSVLGDDEQPPTKIMAARALVDAASNDRNASGMPIAGQDFDRIMDQTIGKPVARTEIELGTTGTGGSELSLDRAALDRLTPQQIQIVAQVLDLLKRAVAGEPVALPAQDGLSAERQADELPIVRSLAVTDDNDTDER